MFTNRPQRKIRMYQNWNKELKETSSTDDSDSSQECSFTPAKRSNPRKQKLQLCRKFMQCGFCPYYSRCKFAHGSHELRKNNEANLKYKTKQCGTFFLEGHCSYGNRCNFLHHEKSKPCCQKYILTLAKLQNFGMDFLYSEQNNQNDSRLSRILG